MGAIQVLFVDDEDNLQHLTKTYLEKTYDFTVDTASNGEEALKKLSEMKYDAVLSDYDMPVLDGIELLKRIRGDKSQIPFIIFTGRGREEVAMEALNFGADFYMQKGGDPSSLYDLLAYKIKKAVEFRQIEEEKLQLLVDFEELVNSCPYSAAIINPDFTFRFINENGRMVLNKCLDFSGEIIGKSLFHVFSKPVAEEFVNQFLIAFTERIKMSFCKHLNGFLIVMHIVPHFNPNGSLRFYYCFYSLKNR